MFGHSLAHTLVATVYRPPAGNRLQFFHFLENLIEFLTSTKLPVVLMGDVNINLISDDNTARETNSIIHIYACSNSLYPQE